MLTNESSLISPAKAALIGVIAALALFAWEGHQGFSLWDEGYLWYGVQRVLANEVPIRDFQAYDPGRYYWTVAVLRTIGTHGIMGVRIGAVVAQAIAIAAALGSLANSGKKRSDPAFIVLSTLTLLVWMAPRHKLFDISISIALVCVLAELVETPTKLRYFAAGAMVGFAAFFGRNHGVYGLVASIGILVFLAVIRKDWIDSARGALYFVAGIIVGYSPLIVMILVVPGFGSAFVDSVKFIFDVKATNLPLPVPWPWHTSFANVAFVDALGQCLIGCFFIGIVLFGCVAPIVAIALAVKRRQPPHLFVACSFAALPYAHYAFSRADWGHLAQGVFPFLIGMLAIGSRSKIGLRWTIAGALTATSLFAMVANHPGWQSRSAGNWVRADIGSDVLTIDQGTLRDVSLLRALKARYAPGTQNFFVAPFWPGAYALFEAKSPLWENYTAWPRTDAFQRTEIARLTAAKPAFVFIMDYALDGRDDLRYPNTHSIVDRYIRENFDVVSGMTDNPAYHIYRPRTPHN